MANHEAAQRKAEHQAAALHNVGWETGAGATIWARVVEDELARHEPARERFGVKADLEHWERLHGTAFLLVVAIEQVLAFERRVRSLTGDAELVKARKQFDAVGPRADALRNLVVHLEKYAVGEGNRQRSEGVARISEKYVSAFHLLARRRGHDSGPRRRAADLRTAGHAAVALAEVVERVRDRHLKRAEREANAALRRTYGLPE